MRLPVAQFRRLEPGGRAVENFPVIGCNTFAVERIASDHQHLIGAPLRTRSADQLALIR